MFSFNKIKSVAALVSGVAIVVVNETSMSALALQLQSDGEVFGQQNSVQNDEPQGDGLRTPDVKMSAQTCRDSTVRRAIEEAVQSCNGNYGDDNVELIQALGESLEKYALLRGHMSGNALELYNMSSNAADQE